jgi:hypothetical protein
MFSRIISRRLSFKICLECKTVCPCIETKSCEYNDFKYNVNYLKYPKPEEYIKYLQTENEPKEDRDRENDPKDIVYY